MPLSRVHLLEKYFFHDNTSSMYIRNVTIKFTLPSKRFEEQLLWCGPVMLFCTHNLQQQLVYESCAFIAIVLYYLFRLQMVPGDSKFMLSFKCKNVSKLCGELVLEKNFLLLWKNFLKIILDFVNRQFKLRTFYINTLISHWRTCFQNTKNYNTRKLQFHRYNYFVITLPIL